MVSFSFRLLLVAYEFNLSIFIPFYASRRQRMRGARNIKKENLFLKGNFFTLFFTYPISFFLLKISFIFLMTTMLTCKILPQQRKDCWWIRFWILYRYSSNYEWCGRCIEFIILLDDNKCYLMLSRDGMCMWIKTMKLLLNSFLYLYLMDKRLALSVLHIYN